MKARTTLQGSVLLGAFVAMVGASARGGDFAMTLQLAQGDKKVATKLTRRQPSPKKPRPRLVFEAEADKRLQVKWKALNESKSATYKNVLVHFFVVPEKEVGQPNVPPLGKDDIEYEGAVTLDFEPGNKAEGEFTGTISKSGSYLVRVETIGVGGREGYEYYAALDAVLK